MTVPIVCVGNPLRAVDSLGPRVLERLRRRSLPNEVELVDGGLRGLDLLPLVERARRVVFVDAVAGFAAPGEVVEIRDARAVTGGGGFGHSAGLAYLLGALPLACDGPAPPWVLVGAEGMADEALVGRVADRAMELAVCD